MAKLDKLLGHVKEHLKSSEAVEAAVLGTYEAKGLGGNRLRIGVMLATNERIVFFAKKLTGYELESFGYGNISSFEAGKNLMGNNIRFAASGNDVSLKWIKDGDVDTFARLVRERVGVRQSGSSDSESSSNVADELQKLAALVEQGMMTREEYESQKARLLG